MKRTSGIALAVALVIATAFASVMLLLLTQNVEFAAVYAENETQLLSDKVVARTAALVDEQVSLVKSDLRDSELIEALAREGANEGSAGSEDVEGQISALLRQLESSDDVDSVFLVSFATSVVYFSSGMSPEDSRSEAISSWAQMFAPGSGDGAVASLDVVSVASAKNGSRYALAGKSLFKQGTAVGVVGACLSESTVSSVMAGCLDESSQAAMYFSEDGTVLFGTQQRVSGTNVFAEYSQLESLRSELDQDETHRWNTWVNLDGLLPHDQELYEIRYDGKMGAYLLCANKGVEIFSQMRVRSTTLLLVMLVVTLLLVMLIIAGARLYRAHLLKITSTDELTGLVNRKSFTESYAQLLEQGNVGKAFIVLIDADRFKQVNDTYGHAAGDEVLASIAAEIRDAVGSEGLSSRWGGDEFLAVFRMPSDVAQERVKHMIERVSSREFTSGVKASVSVGMAELDPSVPLERMIERADTALYQTKKAGRGSYTMYDPTTESDASGAQQAGEAQAHRPIDLLQETVEEGPAEDAPATQSDAHRANSFLNLLIKSLLDAVRKMIPFVAGGGILVAVAFLFDAASVDINSLSADVRSNFGTITPIAAGLHSVGLAAFNFMLPIFAAFLARGLAGNKAFVGGFAGGYLSSQGSAGFVGAICTALISALVVYLMNNFLRGASDSVRRIVGSIITPAFSLLVMYLFMIVVIDPVATVFDTALTSMLVSLSSGSSVVLGAVCGAMMSTDMGGFINKAAYHFGTASIASGSPDIMAAVMVGGMVAPCGIAISMMLFRDRFTRDERDLAPTTLALGLSFITEGALPFVLTDFARVIPSCMAGSALAGALSEAYGCTLMAPHGGIFVFPVVGNPALYFVALMAGSLLCALLLGFLKRPVEKGEEQEPAAPLDNGGQAGSSE